MVVGFRLSGCERAKFMPGPLYYQVWATVERVCALKIWRRGPGWMAGTWEAGLAFSKESAVGHGSVPGSQEMRGRVGMCMRLTLKQRLTGEPFCCCCYSCCYCCSTALHPEVRGWLRRVGVGGGPRDLRAYIQQAVEGSWVNKAPLCCIMYWLSFVWVIPVQTQRSQPGP